MSSAPATSSSATNKGGFDAARHVQEEDRLGRWPLAKEIFRIAANGPREWSVRIGVYGEWGSGKTSVLRFVESMAQSEGHIVFPFNAWQFQSTDDLWKAFVSGIFLRIEQAIGKKAPGEFARQGKRVAAGAAKMIPGFIRLWNSDAGEIAEKGLGVVRKYLTFSDDDLKDLAGILGEKRLIVTVDDLDRTDSRLVPEMLFALKEIMDVPGMSFVCAFDPVVVGQVLGSAHPGFGDGLRFLEKIVDYPRWLPAPDVQKLADLAVFDAETFCPYAPKSDLAEAVALLPKNPRAVRQFIRLLGLLRPQIERHDPKEIQWPILLAANVLKVVFPKIAQPLLDDTSFWENAYTLTMSWEDREKTQQQAIKEKINSFFSQPSVGIDDSSSSALHKCVSAICSRLNAWHGIDLEMLFYQFHLAESPRAVTRKEFDALVSGIDIASNEKAKVEAWIVSHAQSVGQLPDQVYKELLTAAILRRTEYLRGAADAMPGTAMNAELDQAARMLQLIAFLMLQCEGPNGHSYSIDPFHLRLLFEQVGQYFGWRRTTKYRDARKHEKTLLTALFNLLPDAIEPWIEIIGIRQWEGRHEDYGKEWKAVRVWFNATTKL